MIFIIVLLTVTGVFGQWSSSYGVGLSDSIVGFEDAYLSIYQLAHKYGYPIEEHTVITEDEYILKIHRIPYGRRANRNGIPVFLMHGIWDSSDSWLLQGPNNALAYILADEGYDVWLGNARGNKHTFDHKTLDVNSSRFWEFSWEEIGVYDLPAMIDHVLNITGHTSLYYIGYSQGTTTFYVMTSMRPEYNRKVKLMFALASGASMGNTRSPFLRLFAPTASFLPSLVWNWTVYPPDFLNEISPIICVVYSIKCKTFFRAMIGANNVSEAMWPVVLGHIPTGSSIHQFLHYGQLITSGRFCRYDFGRKRNIIKYGVDFPPDYVLDNIVAPVILFYSNNDMVADIRDVKILMSRLPNVQGKYYAKDFTHLDYMYADISKPFIYMHIVKIIQKSL